MMQPSSCNATINHSLPSARSGSFITNFGPQNLKAIQTNLLQKLVLGHTCLLYE